MSAYVDDLVYYPDEAIKPGARHAGNWWCHMTADTLPDLHAMARRIGLKRSWFQNTSFPHYDLVESRRVLAVSFGAVEVRARERVKQMLEEEKQRQYQTPAQLELWGPKVSN